MKGQLIVLYGINNLGKTTQAKLLEERLKANGLQAKYLKYPVYDLEPTGPLINEYLRGGNPHGFLPLTAQLLYLANRTHYEAQLKEKLEQGIHIIAEDYRGTGIAWGAGAGVDKNYLIQANSILCPEDIAFFFKGERFTSGIEKSHRHEQDNALTTTVATVHQELADHYGWIPIDANDTIENIQEQIWSVVEQKIQAVQA